MIIMALVLVLALAACGQKTEEAVNGDNMTESEEPMSTEAPNDDSTDDEMKEDEEMSEDEDMTEDNNMVFTLEELSKYDGNDGQPAYVAVDGIVYDLTNSGAWRNGKHNGFTAGKDLTEEIKNISPHGVKNLEGIPIVGKLADE